MWEPIAGGSSIGETTLTPPVSEKGQAPVAVRPDRAPPAPSSTATSRGTPAAPVTWAWNPILERCREVVRAESVVAADAEGLAVAWVGPLDRVQASRVAAHVSKSFDLLDRLKYAGKLAEGMCVQFQPESTWLTAVRVAPSISTVVTIAVLGPYTLVHRGRDRLRTTFERLLQATRAA
jgi:hypothetical protein